VFPLLKVLQSICAEQDLSLPGMLRLVNHIGQVIMGSRKHSVEDVFETFGVMAVDVLQTLLV